MVMKNSQIWGEIFRINLQRALPFFFWIQIFTVSDVIILVYVDDCLSLFWQRWKDLGWDDQPMISNKNSTWNMKEMLECFWELTSWEVKEMAASSSSNLSYLIKKILKTIGMTECSPAQTPANTMPLSQSHGRFSWTKMWMELCSSYWIWHQTHGQTLHSLCMCGLHTRHELRTNRPSSASAGWYLKGTAEQGHILSPTKNQRNWLSTAM